MLASTKLVIANAPVKFAWTPSARAARGRERDPARPQRSAATTMPACTGVSVEEPDRFWRAVADDLELELARPWDRVLDDSRGIEWTTWFEGARLNLATGLPPRLGGAHARRDRRRLPR